MITIREAVETILRQDYDGAQCFDRGILNLSEYGRGIRPQVEGYAKKEVGIPSIVVALSRLAKKRRANKPEPTISVRQMAVQSPIEQFVYRKTPENLQALARAVQNAGVHEDVFFSFSVSTKDIALVVSESIAERVSKHFSSKAEVLKQGLSAVSIRFDEGLVAEANVGLSLLKRIAAHRIILDAAMTTYNEFTLVFENKYLNQVIEALQNNKVSHVRTPVDGE